jgi:site-specific DNA recombinase
VDVETWDRVRQRLERQTQKRRAARPDDHSFLVGKLYDDRRNRMGASYASKGGRRWRYYVSPALLSGLRQEAGAVARIPAAEIEDRVARAVGTYLAGQASPIANHHINRSFLRGNVVSAQREQTRRPLTDPPTGNDVRNAIERVTVSATRIEIVLSESIVSEGQDRLLTLPWSRTPSRPRRQIIQGVDDLKQPQHAIRTKARDGFVKALRAAHRWLAELLSDPNQTIESLAMRGHKSERSIRMTLSLAFLSPVLAEAGGACLAGSASSA